MDPLVDLSLDAAQALYAKLASAPLQQDDAVRAMANIALLAKRRHVGWGRLRLQALRELGRFLIRNAKGQGRPAKTSAGEVLPTLARLGITDHHISADAKSVARLSRTDFDAYLEQEDEPTLRGLLRFAETTRIGQPYPKMGLGAFARATQTGRSFIDTDDDTSTTEWFTPPELFDALEARFDLDVSSPGAHIVPWIPATRHLTRKENGLVADWGNAFCWMNAPYGVRHGIAEWIEKFIQHGNGIALLPDFTSAVWWHTATRHADAILFVRPKIYFLPKREDGRTNSLGSTLVAIGKRGAQALLAAERNGRGLCFQRAVSQTGALDDFLAAAE